MSNLQLINSNEIEMYVIKRDGSRESIYFDKISCRLIKLCEGLNMSYVNPVEITKKVINGIYSGVLTTELDNLASEIAASMTTNHPDYGILAARISISNLHKETSDNFEYVIEELLKLKLISNKLYEIVKLNSIILNDAIKYERDYLFSYFGFKTLEKSYLLKNNKIIERPQHMLMRVSLGIHGEDISSALETYNLMSLHKFIHGTPTLFNAGTNMCQLSSCFLLGIREDSIEGIFDTLKQCAIISKNAGGLGIHVHNIRGSGSRISSTNGVSNGIVPMLRVFNNTARYVDQGGNKRPGAFAIYIEPWHVDIFDVLNARKNTGKEEMRARDLFYGLWIPDLFMRRVEEDGNWTLMCPSKCPGLSDVYGVEFDKLYESYEKLKLGSETIKAQKLWSSIMESQIETGTPYMLYKDSCNRKSNQQNLGTIKCSNLCTEIIQFTSKDEISVCNLASVSLPKFVINGEFNFEELKEVIRVMTRNLNKIIDVTFYPLEECRTSNLKHRPIGIGCQGLADVFLMLRLPFDSEEAIKLNKEIFETIYYGALFESCNLARKSGKYDSYEGSPISRGFLQFDMWNITPSSRWNWGELRELIYKYGVRNSLLVAPMPTASTAQILGNNESFEPFTSNIYSRRVLSGDFQIVNNHLLHDLTKLGIWSEDLKNEIINNNGSVVGISKIPKELQYLYRTVWEISQKKLLDMSADRGAYIDQSQSMNIYMTSPSYGKLSSMHFYGWKKGLKTGLYYLRTLPAATPIKFTVDKSKICETNCLMCSA